MMRFSKPVVVLKLSTVQRDMNAYGLDEQGLWKKYINDGKNAADTFRSHERHMESAYLLRQRFPSAIFYHESFNRAVADDSDLVIAAGGDEHKKYVSHYVTNTPVLGLNTDPYPGGSTGALLERDIELALEKLEKGEFEIHDETRIEAYAEVNGCRIAVPYLGMSIFPLVRSDDPFGNVRYAIEFGGRREEHAITSGIILYTGNGFTDWTNGAGKYLGSLARFDPREKKIAWVVREPNGKYEMLHGVIHENEELAITCHKDHTVIAADGINEHSAELQSGHKAVFRISSLPLKNVRMR